MLHRLSYQIRASLLPKHRVSVLMGADLAAIKTNCVCVHALMSALQAVFAGFGQNAADAKLHTRIVHEWLR